MAGVELATAYVSIIPEIKGMHKAAKRSVSGLPADIQKEISGPMAQVGEAEGGKLGTRLSDGAGKLLKGGMFAAGAVGATALAKGFGRLKSLDEAEGKLSGLGHSAGAVDKIMENALASVKGTAFGMDEAATSAAGAVAAGIKPGKALEANLKLVADAATIAGTDMGSMGAIFNKVASSNKIQGDTIAQLSDQGIPIIQFLSKELGKSAEEVVDLASKGKINFKQFQSAMETGLGGAAASSGKTFTGAMKNAYAALGRLGASVLSGVFPQLKGGFGAVTTALDGMGPAAEAAGVKFGTFVSKASKGVGALYSVLVKGDFNGAVRDAFGVEEDSPFIDFLFDVREKAMATFSQAGAAAKTFGGVLRGAFAILLPHLKTFGSQMLALRPYIVELAKTIGTFLGDAFRAALPYIKALAVLIGGAFIVALKIIPPIIKAAIVTLGGLLNVIRPMLPAIAAIVAAYAAWRAILVVHGAIMAVQRGIMLAVRGAQMGYAAATYGAAGATYAQTTAEKLGLLVGRAKLIVSRATALATNSVSLATIRQTVAEKARAAAQRIGMAVSKASLIVTLAWGRATNFATLATMRQTIAERAKAVAQRIGMAVTKTMAAAQWLLNAAMTANPIGLVIAGLALLVGGMIIAYKRSETFRRIVNAAWSGIKRAASATVSWFRGTAWPWLKSIFASIGRAAKSMYTNYIRPAFTAFGTVVKWLWSKIVKPYFGFIKRFWTTVFGFLKKWVVPTVRGAFNSIGAKVKWLWSNWIKPYFGFILSKARSVFGWVKNKGWPLMQSAFNSIGAKAKWLWKTAKVPFDALKRGVGAVKTAISKAAGGIKTAWSKLTGYLKSPIKKALSWMNTNFIGGINKLLGTKILSIPKKWRIPTIKGFDTGGYTGPGRKLEPAGIVHKDEFVIRKKSVNKLRKTVGLGALEHLNRFGEMPGAGGAPGYAIGGKVNGLNARFKKQLDAFNTAAGGRYSVNSGYRSNAHQAQLYARYLAGRGPVAARPGSSQHNKGLAADLAPSNARDVHAGLARQFGLIFTVPSESWHIEPTWGRGGGNKGGSFFGGLGGMIPDWLSGGISKIKDKVTNLTKGFSKKAEGFGIAGQALPAVFNKLKDVASDKMKKAADSLLSFGGGSGGNISLSNVAAGTNRAMGQGLASQMGWTGHQWNALSKLWQKESGWNHKAKNASSGAYGIPQSLPGSKMASAGSDWRTNAQTQIKWGLNYIKGRYGNPAAAWAHSQRVNWYDKGGLVESLFSGSRALEFDKGGYLPTGRSTVVNNTGKPEPLKRMDLESGPVGDIHVYVQDPWGGEYHEGRMMKVVQDNDDFKDSIGRMG